jgi:hypothetical protein
MYDMSRCVLFFFRAARSIDRVWNQRLVDDPGWDKKLQGRVHAQAWVGLFFRKAEEARKKFRNKMVCFSFKDPSRGWVVWRVDEMN